MAQPLGRGSCHAYWDVAAAHCAPYGVLKDLWTCLVVTDRNNIGGGIVLFLIDGNVSFFANQPYE